MPRLTPTVIVGVLLESDEPISRLRLMKLLFLARQETTLPAAGAFYDFLPYKFGPFSFAVRRDLHEMMRNGLVAGERVGDGDRLSLTAWRRVEAAQAYEMLPEKLRLQVRELVDRYRAWPDQRLIDHVYARFPTFTVLSERDGRHPERRVAEPAVYTLGYEGSSIDLFLCAVVGHGLARIVDVRNNPVSRRYATLGRR